jgi:hypothetical protein
MKADSEDQDFAQGMKDMLGMDKDQVEQLITRLDADALTNLADAVANNDRSSVEQIIGSNETDETVNPLFRGDNLNDKAPVRKKKHLRKMAANYDFAFGDDVAVLVTDPDTGKTSTEDGTVFLPNGPDHTIGVKIQGKTKMIDRKMLRKVDDSALDEGVLGMVDMPNLERMQQLAGIHAQAITSAAHEPNTPPAEIVVQPDDNESITATDPSTAAQQAMQALDAVAALLPNVRLADLKAIRQRIATLQTSMNEGHLPPALARALREAVAL